MIWGSTFISEVYYRWIALNDVTWSDVIFGFTDRRPPFVLSPWLFGSLCDHGPTPLSEPLYHMIIIKVLTWT